MKKLDLVVVGGGPAGLALGLTLVSEDPSWGQRMVILEKEHHPRHKLCGGGLTILALKQLKRLGLELTIPHARVDTARFTYKDLAIDLPGEPAFVVTRRSEFDHWLAEQALAREVPLQQGVKVESIERTKDGLLVGTPHGDYLTELIAGADGSRGMVRRWLGAREQPSHVARLLEFVTPTDFENSYFRHNYAQFDFTPASDGLQGYFWDFPTRIKGQPHMNLGVYDGRVAPTRDRANLPEILNQQASQRGYQEDQIALEGHPIHWFAPGNTFASERVLLVGDAAGAEPLFGEGIGIALAHSQPAAAAIERALVRSNFSFKDYRRRLLASALGRYLLLRWFVATILYRLSGWDFMMRLVWRLAAFVAWLTGSLPSIEGVLVETASEESKRGG